MVFSSSATWARTRSRYVGSLRRSGIIVRLNIADDERVNLTCDAVRTEMGGTMIPLLRSDPTYRLRVRAQVAELLNTINPNYKDTKQ
jgi:hypothetical protein